MFHLCLLFVVFVCKQLSYPSGKAFYFLCHKSFYLYRDTYPNLEVTNYEIISYSPSKVVIEGLEDNDYYNVLISLEYNVEDQQLPTSANIVMVYDSNRYYVVGVDNA